MADNTTNLTGKEMVGLSLINGAMGLGQTAMTSQANVDKAQAEANAAVEKAQIWGFTERSKTETNAMTARFGILSETMTQMMALVFGDVADRRNAANQRRALRNEAMVATLEYNKQMRQTTLDHAAKMEQIGLEEKQMNLAAKQSDQGFELEKLRIQSEGINTSTFLV